MPHHRSNVRSPVFHQKGTLPSTRNIYNLLFLLLFFIFLRETIKLRIGETQGNTGMQQLLLEILNELKALKATQEEIWNVDDIARYMRLSRSSIQSRIICRKDFPRAIRIPTENGLGGRRWYAKEVKNWVSKNREPESR